MLSCISIPEVSVCAAQTKRATRLLLFTGLAIALLGSTPTVSLASPERPPDEVALSLVVGGAVALGDFEAGVLAELIAQLEFHNTRVLEGDAPEGTPIYTIDIMAGASAGSLTLAMAAQELLYGKGRIASEDDYFTYVEGDNPFYAAWVDAVDILELLPDPERRTERGPFLLDERFLEELAVDLLPANREGEPMTLAAKHQALIFSVSSQEGIDYALQFNSHGSLPFRRHTDYRIYRLEPSNPQRRLALADRQLGVVASADWGQLRRSTLASRAFPFAFSPDPLSRFEAEYRGAWPPPAKAPSGLNYYVDGGFFDNNPFSMAERVRSHVDRLNNGADRLPTERRVIYVDPDPSPARSYDANQFNGSLVGYASHSLAMLRNDASSAALLDYIRRQADAVSRAELLFKNDDEISVGEANKKLDAGQLADVERFKKFALDVADSAAISREAVERHNELQLYALMSRALGLDAYKLPPVWAISEPADRPLPGRHFAHFGAFLNKALRVHDYRLGRLAAQRTLRDQFNVGLVGELTPDDELRWECELEKKVNNADLFLRPMNASPTFRDHIPSQEKRRTLRFRLAERARDLSSDVVGFSYPAYRAIGTMLDDHVYFRKQSVFYQLAKSPQRGSDFLFGVRWSPGQHPDPADLNFLRWALLNSSYVGVNVGVDPEADKLQNVGNFVAPHLRISLFNKAPVSRTLELVQRAVRIEPEVGVRFNSERYADGGGYGKRSALYWALSLRITSLDLRWEWVDGHNSDRSWVVPDYLGLSFSSLALFGIGGD